MDHLRLAPADAKGTKCLQSTIKVTWRDRVWHSDILAARHSSLATTIMHHVVGMLESRKTINDHIWSTLQGPEEEAQSPAES